METSRRLVEEMDRAELKAWESLGRYKFLMFGYWAAVWVHYNRISGTSRPNPWKDLVRRAREWLAQRGTDGTVATSRMEDIQANIPLPLLVPHRPRQSKRVRDALAAEDGGHLTRELR